MDFEYGNRYLLTNVESKKDNPLHEWLIGQICELDSFRLGSCGFFRALAKDGTHLIRTSGVKDVDATDFGNEITVTTRNSVYTFARVFGSEKEADEYKTPILSPEKQE